MRFQVFLELIGLYFLRECDIALQFPRHEFRRVGRLSRVVIRKPLFQIFLCANVDLARGCHAADDVNVVHTLLQPVFVRRSPHYAGQASLRSRFGLAAPGEARRAKPGAPGETRTPTPLRETDLESYADKFNILIYKEKNLFELKTCKKLFKSKANSAPEQSDCRSLLSSEQQLVSRKCRFDEIRFNVVVGGKQLHEGISAPDRGDIDARLQEAA